MQKKPTPKQETVEVRVTAGEKADWGALAAKLRRPLSDVVRQQMNGLVALLRGWELEAAEQTGTVPPSWSASPATRPPLRPLKAPVPPEPALDRALKALAPPLPDTPRGRPPDVERAFQKARAMRGVR